MLCLWVQSKESKESKKKELRTSVLFCFVFFQIKPRDCWLFRDFPNEANKHVICACSVPQSCPTLLQPYGL